MFLYIIPIIRRKDIQSENCNLLYHYYYKTKTSVVSSQDFISLTNTFTSTEEGLTQLEEVAGRICEWLDRQ